MDTLRNVELALLHEEHKQWRGQLDFCNDEISVFEKRLEDLVQRFTGSNIFAELERFQNQFIRQKEVIDILRHDINLKHHGLERLSRQHVLTNKYKDHDGLRKQMKIFLRIYNELKKDYNQLLLKLL